MGIDIADMLNECSDAHRVLQNVRCKMLHDYMHAGKWCSENGEKVRPASDVQLDTFSRKQASHVQVPYM